MKEAFSDIISNQILEKYLQNSLSLIEYYVVGEGELTSVGKKLLKNCIELLAEKEGEDFKEENMVLIYRVWLARLMLQIDFMRGKPLKEDRALFVINSLIKIHQKFLGLKLTCLLETYKLYKDYKIESSLHEKFLQVFKDFEEVIGVQLGGKDTEDRVVILRMTATMRSLELSEIGKQVFFKQILVVKLIVMAGFWEEYTQEQISLFFDRYLHLMPQFQYSDGECQLVEALYKTLLEKKKKGEERLKAEFERSQLEREQKNYMRKRYYLKKKQEQEPPKPEDEFQLQYKNYSVSTKLHLEDLAISGKKNRELYEPASPKPTVRRHKQVPGLSMNMDFIREAYMSTEKLSTDNLKTRIKAQYMASYYGPKNKQSTSSKNKILIHDQTPDSKTRPESASQQPMHKRPMTARIATHNSTNHLAASLMMKSLSTLHVHPLEQRLVMIESDKKKTDTRFFIP